MAARRQQRRRANSRHQRTEVGRRPHRMRQRSYRQRHRRPRKTDPSPRMAADSAAALPSQCRGGLIPIAGKWRSKQLLPPGHDPMEPDSVLIAQDLYSLLQHWILEGPAVRPRVLEKAGERVQIVAYGYFADLVFIPPPGHLVLNQAGVHSVERRMFEKPFQAGQAATDTLPCVWALAIFLFALQHEMNGGWCGSETPAYCNQPDLTTPYRPKNRPSSGPTEPSGKRRRGRGGTGIPNRSCQLRQESVPGVAPTTSRTGTLPKT